MDIGEKRELLIDYAKRFGCQAFVETHTGDGETLRAMWKSKVFEQMHTLDSSIDRAEAAWRRLHHLPHVHCWRGDSAVRLQAIIKGIRKPILFWLNGGSAVPELQTIFGHPQAEEHVVLIDRAHSLKRGERHELRGLLPEDWVFETEGNIIRAHRKETDGEGQLEQSDEG